MNSVCSIVVSGIPRNSTAGVVAEADVSRYHYNDYVVRNGVGNCLDQCKSLRSQCTFQCLMDWVLPFSSPPIRLAVQFADSCKSSTVVPHYQFDNEHDDHLSGSSSCHYRRNIQPAGQLDSSLAFEVTDGC